MNTLLYKVVKSDFKAVGCYVYVENFLRKMQSDNNAQQHINTIIRIM